MRRTGIPPCLSCVVPQGLNTCDCTAMTEMRALESRSTIFQRLTHWVGGALGALFSLALMCVFAFFMFAQCVGDAKSALAWLGLGSDEGEAPEVRHLEASNVDDVRVARSLSRMLQAADLNPDHFGVAVVVSSEFNAMTFGENSFIIFQGLYEAPDEVLDAIMAHEVAHVLHRHSAKSSEQAESIAWWTAAAGKLAGADASGIRQAASWTLDVVMPSYSRDQEREADRTAVSVLQSAGYGVRSAEVMADALEWTRKHIGSHGAGFFSSHPSIEGRIESLRR